MSKTTHQIRPNVTFCGTEQALQERAYSYFIRGYVKPQDNDLLQLTLQSAKHWAYVWHDKDVLDDGTVKQPHCHIIVIYKYNRTPTAMAKDLCRIDNVQNWHFSILHDKYHAFDYLHHRDVKSVEQGKFRYPECEVFTEDLAFFTRGGSRSSDSLSFYNDLVENNLSHREMAKKYGRDYIKNCHSYERFKKVVAFEEIREQIETETISSSTEILECIESVVRRVLHFYLPSQQMPDSAYISAQVTREFENYLLAGQKLSLFDTNLTPNLRQTKGTNQQ